MNRILRFSLLIPFVLVGCMKGPLVKPPVTPEVGLPPTLEKTFGEVHVGKGNTLLIRYKDIVLLVDPSELPAGDIDYLLLTDGSPSHVTPAVLGGLRKNLKTMCPPDVAQTMGKNGFTSVKGMTSSQRVQLKKGDGFLFVSVVQAKNSATGLLTNGYVLEFDSGRNIFISGDIAQIDVLRQFLFSLRDDGKEVHMGFFYDVASSQDASLRAQIISLFQPQVAVVNKSAGDSKLRQELKDQLYSFEPHIVTVGDTLTF
jgi:hypothetical protein